MEFTTPLIEARLRKRYKRFLADVELASGELLTVHTANTGAMLGCSEPGSRVWLSVSDNPKRKYPHSWEIVEVAPGVLCGINTLLSNALVSEAIEAGRIPELDGYEKLRREVPYGQERSRIDILLESPQQTAIPSCYVEVKNVTLADDGVAMFPDAPTARGLKHLRELMEVVKQGERAVLVYCVQREDCSEFRPAEKVDAHYASVLREAIGQGVEVLAYQASVSVEAISLDRRLELGVDW